MVNLYKQDGETLYGIKEFIVDSLEDIKELPKNVRVGSMALVIPTGGIYVFNGKKEWTPIGNSSAGGGSNTPDSSYEDFLEKVDLNKDGIIDVSETSNSITLHEI